MNDGFVYHGLNLGKITRSVADNDGQRMRYLVSVNGQKPHNYLLHQACILKTTTLVHTKAN